MEKQGRRTVTVTAALGLLYLAQGVPFGFATEYLPVVLREQGYTYSAIAALSWLQLPWQLKVLWAKAADHPRVRPRTRELIFGLQVALTMTVAAFGLRTLRDAPGFWFALTALAATLAATQDVFVDAFAVRVLLPSERGYGNTAQVAGYRLGMLVGGAALLLLVGALGERTTLLACAAVVGACTVGAFASSGAAEALRASPPDADATTDAVRELDAEKGGREPKTVAALTRHMLGRDAWVVLAFALTFKLGLHMAGSLLKPMAVDYGWTRQQIGWAVVTVGSVSALLGASAGGALHRATSERRALTAALVVQALTCVPLLLVERLHAPLGLTTFAIAAEHFGSGLGTTVLFAALMSATRPADAGLHYTVLTSANAVAIGVGGLAGGLIADHAGKLTAFVVATIVCLLPAVFLPHWHRAASASSGGDVTGS
jgi:PAT family beta-lactamase induction signal transducer AmpG